MTAQIHDYNAICALPNREAGQQVSEKGQRIGLRKTHRVSLTTFLVICIKSYVLDNASYLSIPEEPIV